MEPLLCYPDPLPADLALALGRAGRTYRAVSRPGQADGPDGTGSTPGPWMGAVVSAVQDAGGALAFCRHMRRRELPVSPLLLVVSPEQLGGLALRDDLFDDFCVAPGGLGELAARLDHLLWRTGRGLRPEVIEHGPLHLNLETYQATVAGRVLDLTYMEHALLRFLAEHPTKVFTREALLNQVWGYEYYGGARTVDVHVRRLRAKLGEEHAHLIQTVRSVGYRLGQPGAASPTPAAASPAASPAAASPAASPAAASPAASPGAAPQATASTASSSTSTASPPTTS